MRLLCIALVALGRHAQAQRIELDKARCVAVVIGHSAFFKGHQILIVQRVRRRAANLPSRALIQLDGDAAGAEARERTRGAVALQGNLDPMALYGGEKVIEREVARLEGELSAAQHLEEEDRHLLARIGRDLRYWMARRSSAELVPPMRDSGKVHFGSTVFIEREDGRRQRWRIVGEDEADPAQETISYVSPLARALVSKVVGDVVEVNGLDVEVIEVH